MAYTLFDCRHCGRRCTTDSTARPSETGVAKGIFSALSCGACARKNKRPKKAEQERTLTVVTLEAYMTERRRRLARLERIMKAREQQGLAR